MVLFLATRAALLAALLALSGCGAGLFGVGLEVEQLCVRQSGAVALPALPIGGTFTIAGAIVGPADPGFELEVEFEFLELSQPQGAADFSFLTDASISAGADAVQPVAALEHSPAGAAPTVRLARLEGDAAPGEGSERFDYLLSLTLSPTAAPVTADLEVCARVTGRYQP
jgi:hypothetical protein